MQGQSWIKKNLKNQIFSDLHGFTWKHISPLLIQVWDQFRYLEIPKVLIFAVYGHFLSVFVSSKIQKVSNIDICRGQPQRCDCFQGLKFMVEVVPKQISFHHKFQTKWFITELQLTSTKTLNLAFKGTYLPLEICKI